jgi:hypothetical protein
VTLEPAEFVDRIDHPYWPMAPGTRWVYRESDTKGSAQKVRVTVTDRTREILGISATVVHDKVTEHGELIENTFDWYAQDLCGNVWYMGENTKESRTGRSSPRQVRGKRGWTAPSRASSCPPIHRSA